jgi:hypothetical protein
MKFAKCVLITRKMYGHHIAECAKNSYRIVPLAFLAETFIRNFTNQTKGRLSEPVHWLISMSPGIYLSLRPLRRRQNRAKLH